MDQSVPSTVSAAWWVAWKCPTSPALISPFNAASGADVTSTTAPLIGWSLPLTSSTVALEAYGIGHHAVYQPSSCESIELNSVRVSYSPSPEPKNSPSGASTVVSPSNVI